MGLNAWKGLTIFVNNIKDLQNFNNEIIDFCDYEGVIDDYDSIEQCKLAWDESEKMGHRKEHFFRVALGYDYLLSLLKTIYVFLFN